MSDTEPRNEATTGYDPRPWYSLDEANAYGDGYRDAEEAIAAERAAPKVDARALWDALRDCPPYDPYAHDWALKVSEHVLARLAGGKEARA